MVRERKDAEGGSSVVLPVVAAARALTLPVGTPPSAVAFGTGAVTIAQTVRGGIVSNVVGMVLITAFAYAFGDPAPGPEF